jgi:type I restriction enzyme M protein
MPKRHRPGTSPTRTLAHIEEVVLATSGEDAFEIVFALAAARVLGQPPGRVRTRHPELGVTDVSGADEALLARVDDLLGRALAGDERLASLDALFEALVPRVGKGHKGQFFTPRHVVEFVVRALAPAAREVVVDPACGSGAFLAHAHAYAGAGGAAKTFGCDVDPRAVRVARLLALAQGRDPATITRGDGLRDDDAVPRAHVVATNPPFAGLAPADGFEVAGVVRAPERDVLFLERALARLRPGGRLGIVLPYNKAAGEAFAGLRRWLVARARVIAVVGLPRETFLPHTSQRTFVLFAKKRTPREAPDARERALFVVSERAGKDTGGEPAGAHDLDDVLACVAPFLAEQGFS